MITYRSKSIYVDRKSGEIISKKTAILWYNVMKITKQYDKTYIEITNNKEYGTIIIEYIHECEKKIQLKLL